VESDYLEQGLLSTLQVFGAQQQGPSLCSASRLVERLLSMEGKSSDKQQIGGKRQQQTHFGAVLFERDGRMNNF
jgi:hypothetical protein